MLTSFEGFAGCGGAALGLREAGFVAEACVEWNPDAANALLANGFPAMCCDLRDLRFVEGDGGQGVHLSQRPDLAWFSPPCQGFSMGGARKGPLDPRNGFPWMLDTLDALEEADRHPRFLVIENVPGLLRHVGRSGCENGKHPKPLACTRCYFDGPLAYFDEASGLWRQSVVDELRDRFVHVEWRVLNCADLGVPQRRERVVLVAWDEGDFVFPEPTHSREALVYAKWVSGAYWREVGLDGPSGQTPSRDEARILAKLSGVSRVDRIPWRTIRQSLDLRDLEIIAPEPGQGIRPQSLRDLAPDDPATTVDAGGTDKSYRAPSILVRGSQKGRRQSGALRGPLERTIDDVAFTIDQVPGSLSVYGGGTNPRKPDDPATRSLREITDEPSTTIPALDPTSNAFPFVGQDHVFRRRLTLDECATLQGFPPGFASLLRGTKQSRFRQIGNAVPPALARALARSVAHALRKVNPSDAS